MRGSTTDSGVAVGETSRPSCIVFNLCSSNVADLVTDEVPQSTGEYYVHIRLTEQDSQSFESATASPVGRVMCVMVGEVEVVAAKVQAVIPGGHITGTRDNLAAARALEAAIRQAPAEPCGPERQ